jgi:hypothetical protein
METMMLPLLNIHRHFKRVRHFHTGSLRQRTYRLTVRHRCDLRLTVRHRCDLRQLYQNERKILLDQQAMAKQRYLPFESISRHRPLELVAILK